MAQVPWWRRPSRCFWRQRRRRGPVRQHQPAQLGHATLRELVVRRRRWWIRNELHFCCCYLLTPDTEIVRVWWEKYIEARCRESGRWSTWWLTRGPGEAPSAPSFLDGRTAAGQSGVSLLLLQQSWPESGGCSPTILSFPTRWHTGRCVSLPNIASRRWKTIGPPGTVPWLNPWTSTPSSVTQPGDSSSFRPFTGEIFYAKVLKKQKLFHRIYSFLSNALLNQAECCVGCVHMQRCMNERLPRNSGHLLQFKGLRNGVRIFSVSGTSGSTKHSRPRVAATV